MWQVVETSAGFVSLIKLHNCKLTFLTEPEGSPEIIPTEFHPPCILMVPGVFYRSNKLCSEPVQDEINERTPTLCR